MPHIQITLTKGRTTEQKRQLAKRMADVLSEEMMADRQYLQDQADRLRQGGLRASIHLALGDPPTEILKTSEQEHCDLIAMTTHGHRLFGDLIHGSTITAVRHKSHIPLLLVRAMQI